MFALGSLVYPKEMLKELKMSGDNVCGSQKSPDSQKGRDLLAQNLQDDLDLGDESADGSMAIEGGK